MFRVACNHRNLIYSSPTQDLWILTCSFSASLRWKASPTRCVAYVFRLASPKNSGVIFSQILTWWTIERFAKLLRYPKVHFSFLTEIGNWFLIVDYGVVIISPFQGLDAGVKICVIIRSSLRDLMQWAYAYKIKMKVNWAQELTLGKTLCGSVERAGKIPEGWNDSRLINGSKENPEGVIY